MRADPHLVVRKENRRLIAEFFSKRTGISVTPEQLYDRPLQWKMLELLHNTPEIDLPDEFFQPLKGWLLDK